MSCCPRTQLVVVGGEGEGGNWGFNSSNSELPSASPIPHLSGLSFFSPSLSFSPSFFFFCFFCFEGGYRQLHCSDLPSRTKCVCVGGGGGGRVCVCVSPRSLQTSCDSQPSRVLISVMWRSKGWLCGWLHCCR